MTRRADECYDVTAPRCRRRDARPGALRRHRRGRHVRRSPASCWRAACRVSGSDAKDSPRSTALRARGAGCTSGTTRRTSTRRDTVVVSSAVRETTPSWPRRAAAGLRVLHRVAGAGRADGRAPRGRRRGHATARPPRPRCSPSRCSAAAPTRRSRSAGSSPQAARTPHDGSGRRLRRRGRRVRRLLPRLPARVAIVTNVEPDHLDHYGTAEAVEAAFDALRRRGRPPAGCSSPARTTPVAAALAEAARAAGRTRARLRLVAGRRPAGSATCAPTASTSARCTADGRRRRALRARGAGPAQRARTPPPPTPRPCRPGFAPRVARRAGRLHRHPPALRAPGRRRRGAPSSTTTRTTRPRSRPCCDAARERRGGHGRLVVVLPAAPLQPHPRSSRRSSAGRSAWPTRSW